MQINVYSGGRFYMIANLVKMAFKHCLWIIYIGYRTAAQQEANGDSATCGSLSFLSVSFLNHFLF